MFNNLFVNLFRSTKAFALTFTAFLFATLYLTGPAFAGKGTVEFKDITVNGQTKEVAFVNLYMEVQTSSNTNRLLSSNELQNIQNGINTSSKLLWDATDGHFLIDKVFVVSQNSGSGSMADIYYSPVQNLKDVVYNVPNVASYPAGTGLEQSGFVNAYMRYGAPPKDFQPGVFAHELVHYILACGDGYANNNQNACNLNKPITHNGAMGRCIEPGNETVQNSTLTQTFDGVRAGKTIGSELCVTPDHSNNLGHDLVRTCQAGYVTKTNQTAQLENNPDFSDTSCWTQFSTVWPHVSPINGLPDPATPSGFQPVDVIDMQEITDNVALMLDRSGSMDWAVTGDNKEVCGDGDDNDNDQVVDEKDCAEKRINFLKAGAQAFLTMAEYRPNFSVGILSYSDTPKIESQFKEVNENTIGSLTEEVRDLQPTSTTAIGDALIKARDWYRNQDLDSDAGKWGILISDGKHNAGSADPIEGANALGKEGVRVNTIGTGQATEKSTMFEIQKKTQGWTTMMMESNFGFIPHFALQMAEAIKADVYIPNLRWKLNKNSSKTLDLPKEDWFMEAFEQTDLYKSGGPKKITTSVPIAEKTGTLTVVLGSRMRKTFKTPMSVDVKFTGPDGQVLDTSNPGNGLKKRSTEYFMVTWLDTPQTGEWDIEVRFGGDFQGNIQKGSLTVFGDSTGFHSSHGIKPTIVPSANQDAQVKAVSAFDTQLKKYGDAVGVSVEGPTGQNVGYSVNEMNQGVLKSTIDSLQYKGSHRVSILYDTDSGTTFQKGEPKTGNVSRMTEVPVTTYSETGSLFVEDGDDPGKNYRDETDYFE